MASAVALMACVGCAPARSLPVDRHVVPKAMAGVSLENFDAVSQVDVDLYTAVQTREAVESEFRSTYGKRGHQRWFFHAFDVANLDFVVARYEPTTKTRLRYVAERRIRVRRSREAERELGVMDVVFEYNSGARMVKPGMSRRDVVRLAGRAEMERPLGEVGAFDMKYPAFCVRFLEGKVAHVWGGSSVGRDEAPKQTIGQLLEQTFNRRRAMKRASYLIARF
jgi:hypothetical protein